MEIRHYRRSDIMKQCIATVLMLILIITSTCYAESSFENQLERCETLSQPLPDNLPSIVGLYQCSLLASFVTPGMEWHELESLSNQINLQPQKIIQINDGVSLRRIYYYSQALGIELVGDPIQSLSLVFVYRDVAEHYIKLPLSVSYTAHTKYDGAQPEDDGFVGEDTPYERGPSAAYMDYLSQIQQAAKWNNLSNDKLLYTLLEFICFCRTVDSSMSQEMVLSKAECISSFSRENCTATADEIVWTFYEYGQGQVYFHFVFAENRLKRVCFKVDPISVFNACLPYYVFEDIETSTRTLFYEPNVYFLLSSLELSE